MKQVLEDVGYNVTLKQVNTGAMYAGVADGSADVMIDSWLPTTDANYWKKYKDQLVDVGISVKKCPEGLVVPKYVKADTVSDLANNKNHIGDKTNWTITGIDAGAGEMEIIRNKMMKAYGLDKKWELSSSSSTAMLTALKKAENEHKAIVTVLWSPHWAFSQWDLKFLKDPKDVFEKPDDIHTLAREGLKEDSPAAYKVLSQFKWSKKDLEKVMSMVHKGMSPEEAAKKWIGNHKDLVNKWTKGVK
ncbi:MAG TPA: glycine betaine ABC transporter substrate-binding protein, partial [Bacillales bacterium]|nr:glycine betaine ABC transporter substrate-binding protein [Bacillales bacterium]